MESHLKTRNWHLERHGGGHLTVPGEEVATPEDISTGGVDFTDERAVEALWDKWRTL